MQLLNNDFRLHKAVSCCALFLRQFNNPVQPLNLNSWPAGCDERIIVLLRLAFLPRPSYKRFINGQMFQRNINQSLYIIQSARF